MLGNYLKQPCSVGVRGCSVSYCEEQCVLREVCEEMVYGVDAERAICSSEENCASHLDACVDSTVIVAGLKLAMKPVMNEINEAAPT